MASILRSPPSPQQNSCASGWDDDDPRYLGDRPAMCSLELVAFRGLQPATDPAGAASPAFDLTLYVDNGHVCSLRHCGGDVEVSYAGVPLARGRTPRFRVMGEEAVAVAVNVTGAGAVGLPQDLFRLFTAERRWGVAMLQVDLVIASQPFTRDVQLDAGQRSGCMRRLA
ncbi:uncharacterized protein LOC100835603 [Brachypodium distachyon]|uniref:uncharacterized protein LOC100835603 n=1 Tax=Brachypodium distachyon TaxID=15368 RepID=UPI0001C76D80|nr:uncharacterized protein LOC100835603 [Brachypodium distachyon]|eukprot:XP_003561723.1 uncharacterized protein LOC100835603 [Brachypodium distachyon]